MAFFTHTKLVTLAPVQWFFRTELKSELAASFDLNQDPGPLFFSLALLFFFRGGETGLVSVQYIFVLWLRDGEQVRSRNSETFVISSNTKSPLKSHRIITYLL